MSSVSPWNKLQNVFIYHEICHFSSPRKEVNKIFIHCNVKMLANTRTGVYVIASQTIPTHILMFKFILNVYYYKIEFLRSETKRNRITGGTKSSRYSINGEFNTFNVQKT